MIFPFSPSRLFRRYKQDESGAVAIEYGLFAALIAVGIVAVLGNVGTTLKSTFTKVNTELSSTAN